MKNKTLLITTFLALISLLIYTFTHTGHLLSQYVNPPFVGYVCAFGIETAVVSLSLQISELRKSAQSVKFFVSVLVCVVGVSAIANIASGFEVSTSEALTLSTFKNLDTLQAIIGLTATGLISLIVFALAEIIGTDVNQLVKQVEKERKASLKKVSSTAPEIQEKLSRTISSVNGKVSTESANFASSEQAEKARAVKVDNRQERLDSMVDILDSEPETTPTQFADRFTISRQQVYTDLKELVNSERLKKNGKGYEVTG